MRPIVAMQHAVYQGNRTIESVLLEELGYFTNATNRVLKFVDLTARLGTQSVSVQHVNATLSIGTRRLVGWGTVPWSTVLLEARPAQLRSQAR